MEKEAHGGSKFNFTRLPPEIRLEVWEATVEPRAVGIVAHKTAEGKWTIRSTTKVPAAMQVSREARSILLPLYPLLEVETTKPNSEPLYFDEPIVDIAPCIPFNFELDTLHLVDRTPPDRPPKTNDELRHRKPALVANVLDMMINLESPLSFAENSGMARMVSCATRTMDWNYVFQGRTTYQLGDIGPGRPDLHNWTRIRHLRLDFGMFVSDMVAWWSTNWFGMWPFGKWMHEIGRRIQEPTAGLQSCDLVMTYGVGSNRKLRRVWRLAMGEAADMADGRDDVQRLLEDGAVVLDASVAPGEPQALLFEVVDPRIGLEALEKWRSFSTSELQDYWKRDTPVNTRLGPFAGDMSVFWKAAIARREFAHGEMAPVHGVCLADYGLDGPFRGRAAPN